MKGQAYILKRVHLEREELLNYHHHKERIKKIKPVITQDLDIKQKNIQKNQAHRYHHNALKFRQQQEKIQVQIKNDILCNKLKEIGYGKYTIKRQMGFPEQQIKKNQSLEKQRSISTLQKRSKLNTIYNESQSISNNKTYQQIGEHNYENDQIQEFENENDNDNEYENDQYEQDFEQDDQIDNQVYQTQSENKNNQNQIKQTNFQKQQLISQFPINQSQTGKIRVKRTTSEQPHDKNFPSFNKKAQFFKNNNQINTFKNIYNNQKSVDLNMNKNKNINNNSKTFDQQELENEFYNGTPDLYKKNQTINNRYNNDINKNDSNLISNKNNENIESSSNNFNNNFENNNSNINNNIQQESQQQLPVFKSARNGIKNQFSDSPQKKRAARSHSSHLNHVQKLQQIRIQIENKHIALRVLNQGPSIKVKKLESDFKDHKKKLSQLRKFHEKITLKPPQYSFRNPKDQRAKQEISVDRKEFYMYENDQDEFFDSKIDLKVKIHEIIFNSTLFQKFQKETDNFYYETYLPSLKTLKSENFDFQEFQRQELQFQIPLKDLFTSSLLIIQLIQKTGENPPKSHGDIEINLKEIFDFNETFTLQKELRNWKEFRYLPNYYSKNMRSKGQIKYTFHIKSDIKQKVEEQLKIYQEKQLQAQQKLQEMPEQQPQMQQVQKARKQSRSKTKKSNNNSVYKLEKISQQQLKYQIQNNNSATIQNNQQNDKYQDQIQIQQQNKEKEQEQDQNGLTFQSNSETKDQKQEQKQIQEQQQQLTQQQNQDIQQYKNDLQKKQQDDQEMQEKEISTYQNPIKNEINQSKIQEQSQQDKQTLNQSIDSQQYSQNFSFVSPQKESENQTQSIKQQSLYQSQNKQNQTQSSHEKSKTQSQKKNIIKKQTLTQNQPENNNKSSFHKKNTNLNNNDTIFNQNSNPQELYSSNKTNQTQKQIQEKQEKQQQQLQKQSLEQSLQESLKNKNQQLKSQQSKRSVNYKEDYESQFDDYMSENNEIV